MWNRARRIYRSIGTRQSVAAVLLGLSVAMLTTSCQPRGQAAGKPRDASAGGQAASFTSTPGSEAQNPSSTGLRSGDGEVDRSRLPEPPNASPSSRAGGSGSTAPGARSSAPATSAADRNEPASPLSGAQKPTFATQGKLAERLRAVVDDAVSRKVASRVGVAVVDLATGQAVGINANRSFKPASVIKLAVLVGAFRERARMQPAQFERLRPLMERMITISDNPSTRRLVNRLGARQVNAAVRELGVERFRVGETGSRSWVLQGSQATPADTALLLAKLAHREVVNSRASEEMLALLGAQQRRRRIPAGLPSAPDLWVGNKTGTLNGIVNDAGIVLQPRSGIGYTLAVYTAGARSEKAGEKLIADLSAVVYGYMASQNRGS